MDKCHRMDQSHKHLTNDHFRYLLSGLHGGRREGVEGWRGEEEGGGWKVGGERRREGGRRREGEEEGGGWKVGGERRGAHKCPEVTD